MIKTVADLEKFLEENTGKHYALRGLSGIYGKKEYKAGEYMELSIDDWDGRDISYHEDMDKLSGTCGLGIANTMWQDDLEEMYNKAKMYTDCGRIVLIAGTEMEEGTDESEVIISNDYDAAEYICEVNIK